MARNETITVLHAGAFTGGRDAVGAPERGPDLPIVSHGWTVAPVDTSEDRGGQVISRRQLYSSAEPGVTIRPIDRIRFADGSVWNVKGEPQVWGGDRKVVVTVEKQG